MGKNRWRQSTVWLHVLTSVGWMAQALALLTLLVVGRVTEDPALRSGSAEFAHIVDTTLLAPMANAAAATGIVLSAATSWGFFRHWWVLVKFVVTVVQLNVGIFVLSVGLNETVAAARAGEQVEAPVPQLVGSVVMVTAIAVQAWLSVVKPGGRTPWAAGPKPATAPVWVFAATIGAVLGDGVLSTVAGGPRPVLSLLVVVLALAWRGRSTKDGKAQVGATLITGRARVGQDR
ncbi:hypothetical protein [Actinokineospora terrae]|uniref:DUF2269 domain-containing protein n=1 Tax=Actinokineospora terrae TaxID=155974 RepID=A0A1H9XME2_9PSEU|nr:hypothetical protein [Actinokineospora terrae]SES47219.1 hypothetical protein SAMN04487818_11711 [Actinokineospora terrae]